MAVSYENTGKCNHSLIFVFLGNICYSGWRFLITVRSLYFLYTHYVSRLTKNHLLRGRTHVRAPLLECSLSLNTDFQKNLVSSVFQIENAPSEPGANHIHDASHEHLDHKTINLSRRDELKAAHEAFLMELRTEKNPEKLKSLALSRKEKVRDFVRA